MVVSIGNKRMWAIDSSYAYTASDGTCKSSFTTAIPAGGVTGYTDISSEADLLDAVTTVGPVSVAIQADQSSFQMYSSGVLTAACGTSLDHGVLAVGFGTSGGFDYWKVKNSWGSSWGSSGYILLQRGINQCGIASGPPSYPTVNGNVSPSPPPPPSPAPVPTPTPSCADAEDASYCSALVMLGFCDLIGDDCLKTCGCCDDPTLCGGTLKVEPRTLEQARFQVIQTVSATVQV